MEAGRELDALVAEKVMGWQRWNYGDDYDGDTFPIFAVFDDVVGVYKSHGAPSYYFHPSTDISAAWQVVEKMQSIGEIVVRRDNRANPSWTCSVFGQDGNLIDIEVYADTAPLAICLAALKAKGVE